MLQMLEATAAREPFVRLERNEPEQRQFYREVLKSGKRAGQVFSIRLAYDDHDWISASAIINRLYGKRGYGSDHQLTSRSECMTFTACCDDEMIGTLTLRVDSAARLVADATFPDELAALRSGPGASLCELTKFAFDPSAESRPLLAKLFHVIFVYGTQRFDCSDLVIEVNPRHVLFYESMLGFRRIGELRANDVVQAPAQLMHLSVSQIGENIRRYADGSASGARSLYPYFFGKDQELDLRRRITASGFAEEGMDAACSLDQSSEPRQAKGIFKLAKRKRAAA